MIAWEAWMGLYGMVMLLTSSVWANRWWLRRFQFQTGFSSISTTGWAGLLAINLVTLISSVGLLLCAVELLSR